MFGSLEISRNVSSQIFFWSCGPGEKEILIEACGSEEVADEILRLDIRMGRRVGVEMARNMKTGAPKKKDPATGVWGMLVFFFLVLVANFRKALKMSMGQDWALLVCSCISQCGCCRPHRP